MAWGDDTGRAPISWYTDGSTLLRRVGEVSVPVPTTVTDPFVTGWRHEESGAVIMGPRLSGAVFVNLSGDSPGAPGSPDDIVGMNDANVFAVQSVTPRLRRFLSDVDGPVQGYLQRRDLLSSTAIMEAGVLHVILTGGQSLGIGGTGSPPDAVFSVVVPHPRQALMLSTGPDGSGSTARFYADAATDFAPLTEAVADERSETPGTGILDYLVKADAAAGRRRTVRCFHAAGAGGQSIDAITVGIQPWLNLLAALDRIIALAAIYGMRVQVDAFVWTHGEANAATDPAIYQPAAETIFAAVRAACDARSVTPRGG